MLVKALILGILLVVCAKEWTYIIKPTKDSTCTRQQCLTFYQFVTNDAKYIRDEMMLEVSAGNHSLSVKLIISNISKLSIVSNSTNNSITCSQHGGLEFSSVSVVTLINLTFIDCGDNSQLNPVLWLSQVNISITTCTFAYSKGRVINATKSDISVKSCIFKNSSAGVLMADTNTSLNDTGSTYVQNSFKKTNVIVYILSSSASFAKCCFKNNGDDNIVHKGPKRMMRIHKSHVSFETTTISDNKGHMYIFESKITFNDPSQFLKNSNSSSIVTVVASTIKFKKEINFHKNKAIGRGGAIRAFDSRVYAYAEATFANNQIISSFGYGGALYLHRSNFICQTYCNFTSNMAIEGGAIYAINSVFTIGNDWNKFQQNINANIALIFIANSAKHGGAVYLDANSRLRTPKTEHCKFVLQFEHNTARIGGAIYVNDYTSTITCDNTTHGTCFIEVPSRTSNPWNGWIKISSTNGNTTFYGGLLDRCTAQYRYSKSLKHDIIGINYVKNMTQNDKIEDMITSEPVRICYCCERKVVCNQTFPIFNVTRGKTFDVPIAAVDQANHTVDALILIKSKKNYSYHLGPDQQIQKAHQGCSNLTLNVFSPNRSIELIIYAEGPCKDFGISQTILHIHFNNCTCPIGFQPQSLETKDNCLCDCHKEIENLITTCNQSSKSLLRQGNFWIDYINNTNTIDYLTYPHCPYDYCVPAIHDIYINLNIPDGADAQCALNRTGLLCSSCKPGLSLSLGSSRCLQCPHYRQKFYIASVLGALASGIAIVVIILVLNLTTAVGTLNGLIFYANIVAINNITYNHMSKPNFFSVFIAWVNLEAGIDMCFYGGLDSYSKAWLQLLFSVYLIAVLIMVILVSKYSSRFAKLIGKRNPIATLATVILLSYMKLFRNIKDIFSVAVLKYPDGLHKRWLPDANIEYLQDKHIPLFLVAIIIVFIGLIYTILLLTWQWLLQASHYKFLGWTRNTRLNLFMEANLAPYSSKQRYWTGLLLLIRVVLYLKIALDTTNNNLLATGIICACLLFIKTLLRSSVYRNKLIDYLDSLYYMNLLILSIIYLNNTNGREIAAKVSVSISFVQLLCILAYHTMITLLEIPYLKTSIAQRLNKHSKLDKILPFVHFQETDIMINTVTTPTTPTSTEIGLKDSRDASAAEITEHEVEQSLTTRWEESDSLREPLLQELKT